MPDRRLRDVLCTMMVAPLFPVPIDIFAAATSFNDFSAGEILRPHEGLVLKTAGEWGSAGPPEFAAVAAVC